MIRIETVPVYSGVKAQMLCSCAVVFAYREQNAAYSNPALQKGDTPPFSRVLRVVPANPHLQQLERREALQYGWIYCG